MNKIVYIDKIIAIIIIGFPFFRFLMKGCLIKIDENSTYIEKDTKRKSILSMTLYPTCFIPMILFSIISADKFHFSVYHNIYIFFFFFTILLFTINILIRKKHILKQFQFFIYFLSTIIPLCVFIYSIFFDKT